MNQKIFYIFVLLILITVIIGLIYKYFTKPKEGFSATANTTDVEALRNVASLYNESDLTVNKVNVTGGNLLVGPSKNPEDGKKLRMHWHTDGTVIDSDPAKLEFRGFKGREVKRLDLHNHGSFNNHGNAKITGDLSANSFTTNNNDVAPTGWNGFQLNGRAPVILNSEKGNDRLGFGIHTKTGWYFIRFPYGGEFGPNGELPFESVLFTFDELKKLKALLGKINSVDGNGVRFNSDVVTTGQNMGLIDNNGGWHFRSHYSGSQAYLDYYNKLNVRRHTNGDRVIFSGRQVCYRGRGYGC